MIVLVLAEIILAFVIPVSLCRGNCQDRNRPHREDESHRTCDAELTKVASRFITCGGIDCDSINLAASGFGEPTRAIAEIACNIFSHGYAACPCKVMPYDISRLSFPLMEQVFNALHIAAENYSVVVSEDKKGGLRMDMDMSHYEKVKDSYKRLESLSEPTISDPKTELITAAKLADGKS